MFLPFLLLSVSYLFILLSPLANRNRPPISTRFQFLNCSDFPQTGFYFLDSQIFKSKRTSAATATAPDPKKRRSMKMLKKKKQISNLNVESSSLKKEDPHLPKVPPPPALQPNSGSCNPSSQIIWDKSKLRLGLRSELVLMRSKSCWNCNYSYPRPLHLCLAGVLPLVVCHP